MTEATTNWTLEAMSHSRLPDFVGSTFHQPPRPRKPTWWQALLGRIFIALELT